MAMAAISAVGDRVVRGVVTGPRGVGTPPSTMQWIDGAHPLPDDNSARAAGLALEAAARARGEQGILLALLSGGGSSMMALPAPGISLEDKRATIAQLSRGGVAISKLNCVRRHLSAVKGGRLAVAAGGGCLTLALSDVHEPQDDPASIASGPTVGDVTTSADALEIVNSAAGRIPPSVIAHLAAGTRGLRDAVDPGDPRLGNGHFVVVANRFTAMDGAKRAAESLGYHVEVIDDVTTGDAAIAADGFVDAAVVRAGSGTRPTCVIASGETTVTVRGSGRGGRNQEFSLASALRLDRQDRVCAVASAGTDGVDGPTDAAGGMVTSSTAEDARRRGIDIRAALSNNDAYPALEALGGLLRWGPTETNVGDVHILLTMGV